MKVLNKGENVTVIENIIYECGPGAARVLHWLIREGHRVRIKKSMHPKTLTGYIVCKPENEETGEAARPIIVYNRRSLTGRWVDEDILEWIEFSNKSVGGKVWTYREGALVPIVE